ncbi:cysteine--tRNA ligase [Suttonella ornithocola]|uniref:Cysteine--tRNA ligase n=1 Tax=Suttonella ornithocola TaxID=279832 RepID=A0A380N081_9GAMM|nr:cysteine--tRNA ligase [Suttonella ornithocola]SUO97533.1 Cysteine--tRNA ligase [Suttonella ornithocola]
MSDLRLYNSLTREKSTFQPITAGKVKMYVCGMTVYDYCHIGHARVMVVFDTLARHLRESYQLSYVRNITDIDDKIIARANENGEPIQALTERFILAMHEDEAALGCLRPDIEPRATAHIEDMIHLIETLIQKGHAYRAENGDVYYRVRSFPDYGKLANRNIEDLRAGERIAVNEAKEDPLDFVLWKAAKVGEPAWQSPWGEGRPGWHIECSAMSQTILGEYFDIHGGGMDLKFPHHECEIAQSEGACGHQHVNTWIHNGFVQIDNEKMSKSLGNFFTVREVLKAYDGETLRFFILQTHYRAPLNYSTAAIEEAKKALKRLYTALENKSVNDGELLPEYVESYQSAMNDDLATPRALAVLFDLARALNKASGEETRNLAHTLKTLGGCLGLLQQNPSDYLKGSANHDSDLDEQLIEALLAERQQAKQNKDYARADAIRQQLSDKGIVIKDTPNGTEWHYQ